MEYDFYQFLKDSQKKCKTKDNFIKKISHEKELLVTIPSDRSYYLNRKAYYKRLEGTEFAAKTGQFKEPDKFNDKLRNLLDGIS